MKERETKRGIGIHRLCVFLSVGVTRDGRKEDLRIPKCWMKVPTGEGHVKGDTKAMLWMTSVCFTLCSSPDV